MTVFCVKIIYSFFFYFPSCDQFIKNILALGTASQEEKVQVSCHCCFRADLEVMRPQVWLLVRLDAYFS